MARRILRWWPTAAEDWPEFAKRYRGNMIAEGNGIAPSPLPRSRSGHTDCTGSTELVASRVASAGLARWSPAGGEGATGEPRTATGCGKERSRRARAARRDGVFIGGHHRCRCCAAQPTTKKVAVEFHAKRRQHVDQRARDNHQASREDGAQLRAKSARLSNDDEALDVSPMRKMHPTYSRSPGAKNETSDSSAAVAALLQKKEPGGSGADDAERSRPQFHVPKAAQVRHTDVLQVWQAGHATCHRPLSIWTAPATRRGARSVGCRGSKHMAGAGIEECIRDAKVVIPIWAIQAPLPSFRGPRCHWWETHSRGGEAHGALSRDATREHREYRRRWDHHRWWPQASRHVLRHGG